MSAPNHSRPLRVAVVNDYEIVVAGLAAVLEPYADRVVVVEITAGVPVVSDVDVVLYDTYAQRQGLVMAPRARLGDGVRLVVFSWDGDEELVSASLAAGAWGYVSKAANAAELVDVIERVHAGERVVPTDMTLIDGAAMPLDPDHGAHDVQHLGRWPGDRAAGLSARESEVLALICRGLSNEEITCQAFIGINTVKTHIRTLYRKIGVARRTQAVLWGHAHGFDPDRVRSLSP